MISDHVYQPRYRNGGGTICKCGAARSYHDKFPKDAHGRPYQKLSNRELEHELGRQLASPTDIVDATVFGDVNKTYLVGRPPGSAVSLSNAAQTGGDIVYTTTTANWQGETFVLEDSYLKTNDGIKPIGQTKVTHRKPGQTNGQSDMEWLRRRVEEICQWAV